MLVNPLSDSRYSNTMLYAALILFLASQAHGLAISYCSSGNNAGSYPAYWSQYQSNGECQTHCQGSYAFAVLQGNYCWCSNYVPTNLVSTYDCNQQCPGYPDEWCGSTDAGLYGYYLLSPGVPLGTSGSGSVASQTPSSSASSSSSSSFDEDSYTTYSSATSTASPSSTTQQTTSTTTTSSLSTTSDFSTITSSPPTSTPGQTEVYTSVTTVTGEVRTVVITPSPTASADATLGQSSTGGGGGVNTGKVVGIVLGVVLGISAIIGLAVWLWFRRRRQQQENMAAPETAFTARAGDTSPSNNVPSRQVSQLSSSGLLGTKAPRINTVGIPPSNDPRSAETTSSGFDRRSLGTDQRLNPYALYIHDESRLSDVSLQDNQDYSRQLRVANPDT